MSNKISFYKNAETYWAHVPATIDGVLGGYGHITDVDIEGSRQFLNNILGLEKPPSTKLALDCGAGIGRVTKNLLMSYFLTIDLVEQDQKFINTVKQLFEKDNYKLGEVYQIGLQFFKPQKEYDVIWCQWVLGHLGDCDLIAFLERCAKSLSENGVIVVKENISDEIEFDEKDSSVTRSLDLMENIFNEAKLEIILTNVQHGFPEDIYPVHIFALRPTMQ